MIDQFRMFSAFFTGSRAYGIPGPTSDIDLVIRMDAKDVQMMKDAAPEHLAGTDYPEPVSGTVIFNFGDLNLLCCLNDEVFAQWIQGTVELRAIGPVDRVQSVAHFAALRGTPVPQPAQASETEQVCLKCGAYAAINCTIAGCPQTADPSKCKVCHQAVTEACRAGHCDIPF